MEPITIIIETDDRSLSADFLGLKRDTAVVSYEGTSLLFQGFTVRKGADVLSDALSFVVEATKNIEFGLIANYLYDKVKNRPDTMLVIRRKVVTHVTPEGIEQILTEQIEGPINRD